YGRTSQNALSAVVGQNRSTTCRSASRLTVSRTVRFAPPEGKLWKSAIFTRAPTRGRLGPRSSTRGDPVHEGGEVGPDGVPVVPRCHQTSAAGGQARPQLRRPKQGHHLRREVVRVIGDQDVLAVRHV